LTGAIHDGERAAWAARSSLSVRGRTQCCPRLFRGGRQCAAANRSAAHFGL